MINFNKQTILIALLLITATNTALSAAETKKHGATLPVADDGSVADAESVAFELDVEDADTVVGISVAKSIRTIRPSRPWYSDAEAAAMRKTHRLEEYERKLRSTAVDEFDDFRKQIQVFIPTSAEFVAISPNEEAAVEALKSSIAFKIKKHKNFTATEDVLLRTLFARAILTGIFTDGPHADGGYTIPYDFTGCAFVELMAPSMVLDADLDPKYHDIARKCEAQRKMFFDYAPMWGTNDGGDTWTEM